MKKLNNFSIFAALSIAVIVTMLCSTLFVGVAGAQLYPMPMPFGYGGYGYPASTDTTACLSACPRSEVR